MNFYVHLDDMFFTGPGQESSRYRHSKIRSTALQQRELMVLPGGGGGDVPLGAYSFLPEGVIQGCVDLKQHSVFLASLALGTKSELQ